MEIENRANIIARAIRAAGGSTISQDNAKTALRDWQKATTADADNVMDAAALFLNLSALNQQLEKAGLIKVARDRSALAIAIEAELAKLTPPTASAPSTQA